MHPITVKLSPSNRPEPMLEQAIRNRADEVQRLFRTNARQYENIINRIAKDSVTNGTSTVIPIIDREGRVVPDKQVRRPRESEVHVSSHRRFPLSLALQARVDNFGSLTHPLGPATRFH
jgi:hypothetical protein